MTIGSSGGVKSAEDEGGVNFMEGIQFVVDESGKKTAVLADLKKYGELWEDFYDSLAARIRADETRESLEAVKERLHKLEKEQPGS